ncbi:HU family DNA-binding protein [Bacteroides sp.]|uniref:HU family DNA-binding protein n=1 Tax=Bacteroides sp. TaxID=29523 RepID=UPI0026082D7E|nr:HU family DNA-binding protein [Bacteroides sp.]MDD3038798.1 DNA-binding protein [Bacteroides sp.]
MARYIMEEMPDINGTGERILYPKLARIKQASTEDLINEIAYNSGFNAGVVRGVITQMAQEMAHLMADGKSVKLDDIGTFTPSLTLCRDKEREKVEDGATHRNAQSIMVGGVNFRVEKKMVKRINGRCDLERAPWKSRRSSQKYTSEERLNLVLKYLEGHSFLTVHEYQKLTGLLHTTAAEELRQWAHQPNSGIGIDGRGTHRIYVKK